MDLEAALGRRGALTTTFRHTPNATHKGRPQQSSAHTACSTQCAPPLPDGDDKKSDLDFGNDVDGGLPIHEHNYCTDLPTQRPRSSNTAGRIHYITRPLSDLRTTQDHNRHRHHHCNRYHHDRSVSMGITESPEHS